MQQCHLWPGCRFSPDPQWASPECLQSSAALSCNFHGPSVLRRRSKCGRTGGCLSRFPGSSPPGRRVHRTRTCDKNKGIIKIRIAFIITKATSSITSWQTGSSRRRRAVTETCKLDAWDWKRSRRNWQLESGNSFVYLFILKKINQFDIWRKSVLTTS